MGKNKDVENVTPIEEQVEEVVNETPVVEEVKEETPVVEEKIIPIGVVVNCSRLNVRKAADVNSKVVCEINSGTEVTIDETLDQFYKVTLKNGIIGFCMKKYIKIK